MDILQTVGYIGYVVGAIVILSSKTKTDNLSDLKERVSILEKEREYSREQHIENQKAISNLEGQLSTYKEIPLKSIAGSLEKLTESNSSILNVLKGSAANAKKEAETGGLLVRNTKKQPLSVKEVKE